MSSNNIDLVTLLELANEQFLPAAFHTIIGREPDIIGLIHYAKLLQDKLPRVLVLAELRHSPEGQAHAADAVSDDLDTLVARYRAVRHLPLKGGRWLLLPRIKAHIPPAADFNWERWANDHAAQLHARAAQQAIQAAQAAQAARAPMAVAGGELAHLHGRLEGVAVALHTAVAALREKGAPEHALQTLRDAAQAVISTPPDPASVSWEARQALNWFAQMQRA